MKPGHSHLTAYYESIFMAAPCMYILLQPDSPRFTIATANEAYLKATSRSREDLIGKGIFEAFPVNPLDPESSEKAGLRASLEQVIANKVPHEMSIMRYDIRRPAEQGGGFEEKYWKPLSMPVFDERGDIRYIIHRVEEKTEQVRVERDRERFFEVATDMLVKVGFDGYFKEVSAACQPLLGWTPEEMMARPWLEFLHENDVEENSAQFAIALAGKDIVNLQNRYRCKDGNYRWLSWNTSTSTDQQVIYCAAADVTQSRRIQAVTEGQKEALEMSVHDAPLPAILEKLLRTLEENVSIGVRTSILLLSEDKTHLHTGAAPSLPEAYNRAVDGIPIGEGQGSCGTAAATGLPYGAYDIATDPAWEGGRQIALDHGLRSCWSTPVFSTSGEVLGTFALYSDKPMTPSKGKIQLVDIISRTAGMVIERERNLVAKRLAEEQLIKARNDAEAANIAKSEFLTNMSHEIRTPMNVVMGIADILMEHENLTETQAGLMGTLQTSANSLLELIDDLLDLSKIESQSIGLEHLPFRIDRLLEDVSDMMSIRAEEKGLRFVASGHQDQPITLIGDPARLRQVILNLCSNALKFTEEGEVSIHLSVTPSEDPAVVSVTIAVKDTGIGIDESKMKTIFHKFTQADSSINRKFGGTGLGLSITKRLVEVMRGTIEVESTLGAGSAFTVTLPLEVAAVTEITMPTPGPGVGERTPEGENNPQKVLLVEDFEPNAIIAGRYLRIFGYTYDVAFNGAEAVEKAKAERYAAILMDVQMPELNGFEATRLIRIHERGTDTARTPIIAMTAHVMAGDRERCLEADMDDYLPKPFNAVELREKLEALIPH